MKPFEIAIPETVGEGKFFREDCSPCCSVGIILDALDKDINFGRKFRLDWRKQIDEDEGHLQQEIFEYLATLFNGEHCYNYGDVFGGLNSLVIINDTLETSEERKKIIRNFVDKFSLAVTIKK